MTDPVRFPAQLPYDSGPLWRACSTCSTPRPVVRGATAYDPAHTATSPTRSARATTGVDSIIPAALSCRLPRHRLTTTASRCRGSHRRRIRSTQRSATALAARRPHAALAGSGMGFHRSELSAYRRRHGKQRRICWSHRRGRRPDVLLQADHGCDAINARERSGVT